MEEVVLLDAGPLVAALDRREQHHAWVTGKLKELHGPLIVCDAVLTEACFLLGGLDEARRRIRAWLRQGILRSEFESARMLDRAFALMENYRNIPMSLADACLVTMAEERKGVRVFTLDRDFTIYRLRGKSPVSLLSPA